MKTNIKKTIATAFLTTAVCSSLFAGNTYNYTNYDSKSGSKYIYTDNPLGCNYNNSVQQTLTNYGKKWAMTATLKNAYVNNSGGIQLVGSTKLKNKSLTAGFTGGTFINIKDISGEEIYLASVKTGYPVDTVNVDESDASSVGWGINPGKLKLYVAGYKYKKILWWKIKIPIIKSKTVAKTRTVNWQIEIPTYILDRDVYIEVVNVHTPTNRVLNALKDAAKTSVSFALKAGLQTSALYEKAKAGDMTYTDFQDYMNVVLPWAVSEGLITSAKSTNVQNIVDAIGIMIENGTDSLTTENQLELVSLGFDLVTMISEKNVSPEGLYAFTNSLEALAKDKGRFVPDSLEQVEVILANIKPLIENKLNDDQAKTYDAILNVIITVNDWGQEPVIDNLDVVFNGLRLAIDVYDQVKSGSITAVTAETIINGWLDEVGEIIIQTAPAYTASFENFRTNVVNTIFTILEKAQSWL